MTNQTDLFTDLANALETTPDNILTFKQYPDGYTVILSDHRKVTGVQPLTKTIYPPDLPEELRDIYDAPEKHTMFELVSLARALGMPYPKNKRKKQLIEEIDIWKMYRSIAEPATQPTTSYFPSDIPEKLYDVYENPYRYNAKDLRPLAAFLQIPRYSKLRKDQLLDAISSWKDINYVLFDEEE